MNMSNATVFFRLKEIFGYTPAEKTPSKLPEFSVLDENGNVKYGSFFKKRTGKDVNDLKSTEEIDAAICEALDISTIPIAGSGAELVMENGNVMPHIATSSKELNASIDRAIRSRD